MLEILKYTIPAIVVLLCTWLVTAQMFKNENEKRRWELKKMSQKEVSAIRLRAYERITLVLERTQPEHMLLEMNLGEMSIMQVQTQLLRQIRLEYDHNLSQQVYLSDELWDKVIMARDETAAFVSQMARQLPPNATTMDYAQVLMTAYRNNGTTPNEVAMEALKEEVRGIF